MVETKKILSLAVSEDDLKIEFEKLLAPILKTAGINCTPRYNRLGEKAKTVYSGRPDAVHGQVIIEYEAPKSFESKTKQQHAYNQLVDYMKAESLSIPINTIRGVGFDGDKIFFVKYTGRDKPIENKKFITEGPYDFSTDLAYTLLTLLRALSRLTLSAENLAARFGPNSSIAPSLVSALTNALEHWGTERTNMFFEEWKRLFGIVYGEALLKTQQDKSQTLVKLYKVDKEVSFQEILFAVHTYFALLMKLISAELLTLKETSFSSSFCEKLAHSPREVLKAQLIEIEKGGLYAKRGITNFLEGDFFSWYIDAFSPRLEEAIKDMARGLSDFEPATTLIEPEYTRDLLKKLYQFLVPQEIRHGLGEYYTPDWLAELLLNEVGYEGDTSKRLLDPACGSGTFLVLAIQRARRFAQFNNIKKEEVLKGILNGIWGFDLNPLAVIAARTNYLFALSELIGKSESMEIPIYLADSVLWPKKSGQTTFDVISGDFAKIKTSVGEFHVPSVWIRDKNLMNEAITLLENIISRHYTLSEAMILFQKEKLLTSDNKDVVMNFYKEILKLENDGKNGIWARFLKNAVAPLIAGKFQFVVGNPPWIRWGYLSEDYRKATLNLWKDYGLFSLKGTAARLGSGEKDFSMLFTYVATECYLEKDGKLGFLITQEVFKSKGAGEGFRRFQFGQGAFFQVLKAHDLVSIKPFEEASNKTAIIVLRPGHKTSYPVPYYIWSKKKSVKIPTDISLRDALELIKKKKFLARPIVLPCGSWQTYTKETKEGTLRGFNPYKARRGASTEPYGVYWLEIKQILSNDELLVRNLPEMGHRDIASIQERIESEFVYPAVRGADIKRWKATPVIYILMCQDPKTRLPYPEKKMKIEARRTYGYLTNFKEVLLSRGSKIVRELAERTSFYAMFGIGPYTVAPYKVVWKRMASDIVASVISQYKTDFGFKAIIPVDTTAFFPTDKEDEAHYLCAIINSSIVRSFIKSFSSSGRGFGAPSVMSNVKIPTFDKKNPVHVELAKISKKLHELSNENGDKLTIANFENDVNRLTKKLFGIQ